MTDKVLSSITSTFSWLADEFGCSFTRRDTRSIELKSPMFRLRLNHGGTDLPTLDWISDEHGSVDLWEFFLRNRPAAVEHCKVRTPPEASIAERETIMISVLSCALRGAGKDILNGQVPDELARRA